MQRKLDRNTWICLELKGNPCSFLKKLGKLISRVLVLKFFIEWKKNHQKSNFFVMKHGQISKKSQNVGKTNGGIWNYINLSIIQDQFQHNSSIRWNLAREWRVVVQTSKSQFFANPRFSIFIWCKTVAKVLVSPE